MPRCSDTARARAAIPLFLAWFLALGLGDAAGQASAAEGLVLSVPSGTYRTDQLLVMENRVPGTWITYSLEKSDGSWHNEINYREALRLAALQGEERTYHVRATLRKEGLPLQEREVTVRIDRLPPRTPVADPPGGAYLSAQRVSFRADDDAVVYYSLNADILTSAARWDGQPLVVDSQGDDRVLQFFALDAAGNRSATVTQTYSSRSGQRGLSPRIEIVSPAEGVYANLQLLYLVSQDVGTIRYTLDGSDPVRSGSLYTEPRLLEYTGRLHLRVAAFPAGSDLDPVVSERVFDVAPEREQSLVVSLASGVYGEDRSVQLLGADGDVLYTLADETPAGNGIPYRGPIALVSTQGARRIAVLRVRVRDRNGIFGPEYRYCYVLDRRTPSAPEVEVQGRQPSRDPLMVRVIKEPSVTVRYTTDGTEPTAGSPAYGDPVRIVPPAAGDVTFRAASFDTRGTASTVLSRLLRFDTVAPSAPRVTASETASNRAVRLTVSREAGTNLLQEIGETSAPRAPGVSSPAVLEPVVLDVPMGYHRVFYLRYAVLDEAGNLSPPTETIRVVVDKEPPVCPPFLRTIDGTQTDLPYALTAPLDLPEVHYEQRSDGSIPPDPSPASATLRAGQTLSLPGRSGERIRYAFKFLLRDEVGNLSDVFGPFSVTVDRRKPAMPRIEGVTEGARVSNPVIVRPVQSEDDPVRLVYSLTTDGSTPPPPTPASPLVDGQLEIPGVEGQETTCNLVLLPLSKGGNITGDPVRIGFVIDRKPPPVPRVQGPPSGSRSPRPVVLTLEPGEPLDEIHVSDQVIEEGGAAGEIGDPTVAGRRYTGPLLYDAPDGREVSVVVRATAVDRAGNRSRETLDLTYVVDKRPPGPVRASGLPAGGVTREPVTVTLVSDGAQILYEMSDDGSQPRPPGEGSPVYVSPFVVSGRDGTEVVYRIRARALDTVGNAGPADHVDVFTLDRVAPPPPPEPSVAVAGVDGEVARYVLAWPESVGAAVYYRVTGGAVGEYRRYGGPLELSASSGEATLSVESYAVDAAGNQSATVSFSLFPIHRLPPPVVTGAADGAVYRSDRTLVFQAPAGEIRYELTLDGTTPPAVTSASPRAPGALALGVPDGATLDAALRMRAFPTSGAAVASVDTLFRLQIDKTPPEPPVAEGITDGGHYPTQVTVHLLSSEGTIYYGMGDATRAEASDANRYREPLLLRVADGEEATYRLWAFTVDDAGNSSRGVRTWNVTLDGKTIYVAEDGSDRNPGTRDRPLRSLDRAVRMSAATARKEVRVALGTYTLATTLRLPESITILGGYTAGWQSAGLGRKATLTPGPGFPGGAPLVEITGSRVHLGGIRLTHPPGVTPTLLSIRGSTVRLQDCAVFLTRGNGRVGISQEGGQLDLVGSELDADEGAAGTFLATRAAALSVASTTLRGPRSSEAFAALTLRQETVATLTGVRIEPGGGRRSDGIVLDASSVVLTRSTVDSGGAGSQGAAIRATGSKVQVVESTLAGLPAGAYTFAIYAELSSIAVERSRVNVAARAGATGIRARGGELRLIRTEVRAATAPEFSYIVDLSDTRAVMHTNILLGASSGDSVVALLGGGQSDWFNNTIVAGTGTGLTAGFYLSGDGRHRLINNILLRNGPRAGTALIAVGGSTAGLTLQANDFAGWSNLLAAETAGARGGRGSAATARIADVAALDASDNDAFGGPIHANVSEEPALTFRVSKQEDFHLAATSLAVNGGIDVGPLGGPTLDMDGEARPAPAVGDEPAYDIGADELY